VPTSVLYQLARISLPMHCSNISSRVVATTFSEIRSPAVARIADRTGCQIQFGFDSDLDSIRFGFDSDMDSELDSYSIRI